MKRSEIECVECGSKDIRPMFESRRWICAECQAKQPKSKYEIGGASATLYPELDLAIDIFPSHPSLEIRDENYRQISMTKYGFDVYGVDEELLLTLTIDEFVEWLNKKIEKSNKED